MATQVEFKTISDLEAIPDDGNRYELIEGEILMSRAPGITHQRTLRNLMECFFIYLASNPVGETLPGPGLIFDEHNAVIPDLVFISNRRRERIMAGERLVGAPELVIEIVSPGKENEERDKETKARLYGKFGVKEYWIVDPESQDVAIHVWNRSGHRVTYLSTSGEITSPRILPGFACKVGDIFDI